MIRRTVATLAVLSAGMLSIGCQNSGGGESRADTARPRMAADAEAFKPRFTRSSADCRCRRATSASSSPRA